MAELSRFILGRTQTRTHTHVHTHSLAHLSKHGGGRKEGESGGEGRWEGWGGGANREGGEGGQPQIHISTKEPYVSRRHLNAAAGTREEGGGRTPSRAQTPLMGMQWGRAHRRRRPSLIGIWVEAVGVREVRV